jgi:AAA ATPase containing von Willebrand factor type A (vWA) domain
VCECATVGSKTAVEGDVEVAEDRNDKGDLKRGCICKGAVQRGNDGATDNRGAEEPGPLGGVLFEAVDGEGEDGGEHDGVEETDHEDGPEGDVAGAEDGDGEQANVDEGVDGEEVAGFDNAEEAGADEAPDHGATPVEEDEGSGEAGGIKLAGLGSGEEAGDGGHPGAMGDHLDDVHGEEVVHEIAADGDFRANINKDAEGAEGEVAVADGFAVAAVAVLVAFEDFGHFEEAKRMARRMRAMAKTMKGPWTAEASAM